MLIKSKLFHHDNIQLQLLYHKDFDIYTINIHRFNDSTNHDLFGIFLTQAEAEAKFKSISL